MFVTGWPLGNRNVFKRQGLLRLNSIPQFRWLRQAHHHHLLWGSIEWRRTDEIGFGLTDYVGDDVLYTAIVQNVT